MFVSLANVLLPSSGQSWQCALALCTPESIQQWHACPLQVNGVDLRGAAHEDAITVLRQTPAKVRLMVLRDESQYRDEENLDVFRVELQKKTGRGLGLSIVGKR